MNSLKNSIVAILLLGVSYGVYQVLTTPMPDDTQAKSMGNLLEIDYPKDAASESASPTMGFGETKPTDLGRSSGRIPDSDQISPSKKSELGAPQTLGSNNSQLSPTNRAGLGNPAGGDFAANQPKAAWSDGNRMAVSNAIRAGDNAKLPPSASHFGNSNPPAQPSELATNPGSGGLRDTQNQSLNSPFPGTSSSPATQQNNAGVSKAQFASGLGANSLEQGNSTSPPNQTRMQPNNGVPAATEALVTAKTDLWQRAVELANARDFRRSLEVFTRLEQTHQSSMAPDEREKLYTWLDSLAAGVIYSNDSAFGDSHYVCQGQESLKSLAQQWSVSVQLVFNVNRDAITSATAGNVSADAPLPPGTKLKQIQGPFSAAIDLNTGVLTLYGNSCYAGRFKVVNSGLMQFPVGQYVVEHKALNDPRGKSWMELKSVDANATGLTNLAIHGPSELPATERVMPSLEFSQEDSNDLFAILIRGAEVQLRR